MRDRSKLLGMNISTAQNRLRKQLLFRLVQESGKDICHRCGLKISYEKDLSIEHKTAWMSSEYPKDSFFDYYNIAYSHLSCNIAAAVKVNKKFDSCEERRIANKPNHAANMRKHYTKERRREIYLATGH